MAHLSRSRHENEGGKLKDAARHWAGGGKRDYSQAAKEAREFGVPEEIVAKIESNGEEHDFEVWPDNWDKLCAFLKVATQWRTETLGGGMEPSRVYWLGLVYSDVAAGLAGHGIAASPAIWEGLRLMEAAAKNVLNGAAESD